MHITTVAVIAWLGVATAFIPSQIPRRNALGVSPAYPKAVAPVRAGGPVEDIPLLFSPSAPVSCSSCLPALALTSYVFMTSAA